MLCHNQFVESITTDTAKSYAICWKETVTFALGSDAVKENGVRLNMTEWYVYDKDGKKRKALPHEIPKPIEHGCDLTNGEVVFLEPIKPKKGSEKKDVHKQNRQNV